MASQDDETASLDVVGTHLLGSSVAYFEARFVGEVDQAGLRVGALATGGRVGCQGPADPETGGSSGPWGFRPESFACQSVVTYWMWLLLCSLPNRALPSVLAGLGLRLQVGQGLEGSQKSVLKVLLGSEF